eukprot:CAMPEP_0184745920 /NCGR_PEP_ID=MMETSP0315-20130426/8555_1 /TAXON_ID=101924 /ORGANISM="Rhodosorus marinus, Strain UTEX LB 2760" /LENGTH=298 /DNA_ID=CAMNT_0027218293 /DNA_START=65 /DNA_END=961 /DNA_ORIENTATION=+
MRWTWSAPLGLGLTYLGTSICAILKPDLVAGFVSKGELSENDLYLGLWRLLGVELLGVALVTSKQILHPHRGVFLGMGGFCFLLGTLSLLALTQASNGWNPDFAASSAFVHWMLFIGFMVSIVYLPMARSLDRSPKFLILVMTALLFCVGMNYFLMWQGTIARFVLKDVLQQASSADLLTMGYSVVVWGIVKVALGIITMTMAPNASKYDLMMLGAYAWLMVSATGLLCLNHGKGVFDANEAHAAMALYGALALAYVFLGLTYDIPPRSTKTESTKAIQSTAKGEKSTSKASESKKTK